MGAHRRRRRRRDVCKQSDAKEVFSSFIMDGHREREKERKMQTL
jgi:hypothetical protein